MNPRTTRPARAARARPRRDSAPAALHAPLPLRSPAALAVAAVAALCVALTVSYRIYDPDIWQHLAVGRAIWQLGAVPQLHLWTWPGYGQPDVLPSWGFRALLWPFWWAGGVWGLFAWRWLMTLATFAVLWAAARRLGARGLTALVAMTLCAMIARERSQVRPETLVGVLMALELWILETRRTGGPDRTPWLIAIAWAWANVHLSYVFGLGILLLYALDAQLGARKALTPWLVLLASCAVSLLNPYGWRALWQPFEFALHQRGLPIFSGIAELQPLAWRDQLASELPLLVLGWPLLMMLRARRAGFDRVELALCALFTALQWSAIRFLGSYAIVAAPFVARGLDAVVRDVRWPAFTAAPATRAVLAAAACVAIAVPAWRDPLRAIGVAFEDRVYPVAACDFIERHGVRGRAFNHFHLGSYMLWRFWPERDRLPFMDIHQSGTREDLEAYVPAFVRRSAFDSLDARRHFDYVLLDRYQAPGDRLADMLDADSSWALVFADDIASLFVRRRGALAGLADSFAYHVPAGQEGATALGLAPPADPAGRARVLADLDRMIASSSRRSGALMLRANLLVALGRSPDARRDLQRALAEFPRLRQAHQRLGLMALMENRPAEARDEFLEELRGFPRGRRAHLMLALSYWQLGEAGKAREQALAELKVDPGSAEARRLLQQLAGDQVPPTATPSPRR